MHCVILHPLACHTLSARRATRYTRRHCQQYRHHHRRCINKVCFSFPVGPTIFLSLVACALKRAIVAFHRLAALCGQHQAYSSKYYTRWRRAAEIMNEILNVVGRPLASQLFRYYPLRKLLIYHVSFMNEIASVLSSPTVQSVSKVASLGLCRISFVSQWDLGKFI